MRGVPALREVPRPVRADEGARGAVIHDTDFQAVTPEARTKTHFLIVDCVGVMEEQKAKDARALAGLPEGAPVTEAQVEAAQAALREEAAAPIAYAPMLCDALLAVRRDQEVTLDVVTLDEVTRSRARRDLVPDHDADKALIGEFETFCQEHRDEIDALMVLYERLYAQRLTRKQLMELVAAIQRPPRRWTGEELWAAYERV